MGGMTISFNLLETQFSIITKYVHSIIQFLFLNPFKLPFQRYAEASSVEEYMRLNGLS